MQRAADIKRRLLHRDMVYKGFIRDCRIAVATTTNLANVAKERFQIQNAGATSLFTRSLTASAMLSSFLKGEERIILEMQDQNDAALSHVYAESLHLGEVRGFIHGKDVHDAAKENQGAMSPNSIFQLKTILYHHSQPFVGAVYSEDGTLDNGLHNYFEKSEQVESLMRLYHDNDGQEVLHNGGVFIQRIADSDGEVFHALKEFFQNETCAFSTAARPEDQRFEDFVNDTLLNALPGMTAMEELQQNFSRVPVDFFCRCSKEGFLEKLAGFPQAELKSLLEDEEARQLTCQFCNANYPLDAEDLKTLINE